MISGLLITCLTLVTNAPGWSYPVITINDWYPGVFYKDIELTDSNHIHQVWDIFENEVRVAYKIILPDGTELYPETMISNDVFASYPTTVIVGEDSVAAFWREGGPAWHQVREHDGTVAVPTGMLISTPYVIRPSVHASGDTLGRIHATFETTEGVCYGVFEPGIGEVFRDTIPDSRSTSQILVDGDRVHITFNGMDLMPDYIQYDLEGNVTVPTVSLVGDLNQFRIYWTMAVDNESNLYCLFKVSRTYYYISLFKLNGSTGQVMIYDKMIHAPQGFNYQRILATPSGDSFYLMWIEDAITDLPKHIKFAMIDKNGDFIIEPYSAYDYTDEEIQQLQVLRAVTNEDGDIFAVWDQGDVEVGGSWIVLGWFDHNFLGVEEPEEEISAETLFISASQNPFTETVSFMYTGSLNPQNLLVYDLSGRLVRTLEPCEDETFFWDGNDYSGNPVSPGTYLVRIQAGESTANLRITRI
jgi:hypothetical protein